MRMEQPMYARLQILAAIDEVDDCLNVNKYACGHVYSARHFLQQALLEIERTIAECK